MSSISAIAGGVVSGSYLRPGSSLRTAVGSARQADAPVNPKPASDPTTGAPGSATPQLRPIPSSSSSFDFVENGAASSVQQEVQAIGEPTSVSSDSQIESTNTEAVSNGSVSAEPKPAQNSSSANERPAADAKKADKSERTGQTSVAEQKKLQGEVVNGHRLSPQDLEQLRKLKGRDAGVRQHEQAHLSKGGSQVRGGASFEYQTGADGKQYAVGGEVQIDLSTSSGNPQETLSQLQQVRSAALAPADPSGQDLYVASEAERLASAVRREIQQDAQTPATPSPRFLSQSEAEGRLQKAFPKSPAEITQSVVESSLPQFPGQQTKQSAVRQIIENARPTDFGEPFAFSQVVGQEIDFTV